jgi:hypothetical protein
MTLQDFLKQHGIHTIAELTRRTGLTKQYGWLLWHGRVNIGLRLAKRLGEALEVPYHVFLDLQRPVPPAQRAPGRPRGPRPKRKEGEGQAEGRQEEPPC